MRIETADRWYLVRTLDDGIVHIQEPYLLPFYRCNIWFVHGQLRSLLVDTGSGLVNLCEQVACLGEGPVLAVATHSHFDHIGSHHEFGERAVHPSEARHLAEPGREAVLIEPYATTEMFSALPPGGFDRRTHAVLPAPATRLIEDGDTLDFGERHFEVSTAEQNRSKGRRKTGPFSVMRYAVLRVVPLVHRRAPRCFA